MVTARAILTEEEMQALRSLATREGIPVDAVIRRGINAVLQAPDDAEVEDRRQRALAAIGAFRSGLHDVSERHDDSLAEASDNCASS